MPVGCGIVMSQNVPRRNSGFQTAWKPAKLGGNVSTKPRKETDMEPVTFEQLSEKALAATVFLETVDSKGLPLGCTT